MSSGTEIMLCVALGSIAASLVVIAGRLVALVKTLSALVQRERLWHD